MKKFVFLFRMDITTKETQPSQAQMKIYMQQWMEWINFIAGKSQLANTGNHFSREGLVVRPGNTVSEGPYVADHDSVAGFITVLAKDLKDAAKLAAKCPILNGAGTSVEIREVATPGQ